jgi:RNA polymerase sigma-70 factor (ECF subfamily)
MLEEPQTGPKAAAPAVDDETDLALLTGIRSGNRAALKTLYVKYYPRLLRFIYRITGQLELAQEGINDTMLVVWRDSGAFQGRSTVATWIMGIAYRKALSLHRDARRRSERQLDVEDFDEWIERSGAAERPRDSTEIRDLLTRAIFQLSPDQRAVVELTYFYGCSYKEIAEIVSCPVNTVKTRMFHARRKLKTLLPRLGRDDVLP